MIIFLLGGVFFWLFELDLILVFGCFALLVCFHNPKENNLNIFGKKCSRVPDWWIDWLLMIFNLSSYWDCSVLSSFSILAKYSYY